MLKLVTNPEITFDVTLPKNPEGQTPTITLTCKILDENDQKELDPVQRLEKTITDWDGMVNEKDKPIKFDPKLIPLLARQAGFLGNFQTAYTHAVVWGAEKNSKGLPS